MAILTPEEKTRLKQLVDECQGGLVSDELLHLTDRLVGNDALHTLMVVELCEATQYQRCTTRCGEEVWARGFTDEHMVVFGPLGDRFKVAVPDELYRQIHVQILKKAARNERAE